ncbi:MAG TPA: hypothetical protein GX719_13790 [Gammaproteobacteria bacterium]|nr:hypothetical protein [Gammaproteobacteria bacterium]
MAQADAGQPPMEQDTPGGQKVTTPSSPTSTANAKLGGAQITKPQTAKRGLTK